MRPSTHSAICAEIQQEHMKKVRRLMARIEELGEALKQIDAALQGTLANATDMRDMAEDVDAAQQIARAALGSQAPVQPNGESQAAPQASRAPAVAHGWQPITTAPTGQRALLWAPGWTAPVVDDWGKYSAYNHPKFTHWMPLPALPESQPVQGSV